MCGSGPGCSGPRAEGEVGEDKGALGEGRIRPCKPVIRGWTRHRGLGRVGRAFTFTADAHNLIRIPKLQGA